MTTTPFETDMQLDGWTLFWARLEVQEIDPDTLAARRTEVAAAARARFTDTASISRDPVVAVRANDRGRSKRPVIVSAITSNPWPRRRGAYSFGQNVNPSMSS